MDKYVKLIMLAIYLSVVVIIAAIGGPVTAVFGAISYGYMLVVIYGKQSVWSERKMILTATKWGGLIFIVAALVGAIPAYLLGIIYTFHFSGQTS